MTDSTTDSALTPELGELIERRTSLQQWLAGLDEQRGVASERILARVREDYEARLAATNAELSEHVAGIRTELERAAEQASEAEQVHETAMDSLEESRLRHAIGELPDEGWAERERQLLEAVQAAKIAEDEAHIAADRLRDLLGTLTGEQREAAPLPVAPEPIEPAPEEPLVVEAPVEHPAPQPIVDSDQTVESGPARVEDDGEAFIEQVSVAVEEEDARPEAPGLFDDSEMPSPEKKPPPGLKCAECGYTNDLSAWFCGVCGADVG